MIAKMLKAYVAVCGDDRDRLLDTLRELGVVHLKPVEADQAVADEQTTTAIDRFRRAMQILSSLTPAGETPDMAAGEAADETLRVQRESGELQSRLAVLHRQLEQLAIWGDVQLEELDELRQAGLDVRFFVAPTAEAAQIEGELVQQLAQLPGKRSLTAVIQRHGETKLPESAEPLPLPSRDRPAIRAEAAEIDARLKRSNQRLAELTHLLGPMETEQAKLVEQAKYTIAQRGGLGDEQLFAIQGWIPAGRAETLAGDLARANLDAGVEVCQPEEDEEPPTLIQYPRWAMPIKGLFDILGTLPGYKEIDLSPFFMISLPLFAAMLIGDAGYGLIFLLLPILLYRKMVAKAGKAKTHLVLVVGAATLVWGVLSANYFGMSPQTMANAGGFTRQVEGEAVADTDAMRSGGGGWAAAGKVMIALGPIWRSDAEEARTLLMKISFILGTIHLTLAQLRKALAQAPRLQALASVGWAVFLWGMLGIVWYLMFAGIEQIPWTLIGPVLAGGYLLVLLFSVTRGNPLKRILVGFASSLLPAIGTFSDTMSYVRLMAVGLASCYIAAAFNGLGATLADSATWFAAAPVILFGHLLNIGLAVIAIFAHGVRLNMLEFSNNVGVQWAGYAYEPFAREQKP